MIKILREDYYSPVGEDDNDSPEAKEYTDYSDRIQNSKSIGELIRLDKEISKNRVNPDDAHSLRVLIIAQMKKVGGLREGVSEQPNGDDIKDILSLYNNEDGRESKVRRFLTNAGHGPKIKDFDTEDLYYYLSELDSDQIEELHRQVVDGSKYARERKTEDIRSLPKKAPDARKIKNAIQGILDGGYRLEDTILKDAFVDSCIDVHGYPSFVVSVGKDTFIVMIATSRDE